MPVETVVRCEGQNVKLELHRDRSVDVIDYDIEADMAELEFGEEPSMCLKMIRSYQQEPIHFMRKTGVLTNSVYKVVILRLIRRCVEVFYEQMSKISRQRNPEAFAFLDGFNGEMTNYVEMMEGVLEDELRGVNGDIDREFVSAQAQAVSEASDALAAYLPYDNSSNAFYSAMANALSSLSVDMFLSDTSSIHMFGNDYAPRTLTEELVMSFAGMSVVPPYYISNKNIPGVNIVTAQEIDEVVREKEEQRELMLLDAFDVIEQQP